MLRLALVLVLIVFVARSFWRLVDGLIEGVAGPRKTRGPGTDGHNRDMPMVRDPVCGTFVLPDRAVSLSVGRRQLFFCSTACRDTYRARTA